MRLAPKMFVGTAVVSLLPVGAAAWSLVAMSRLVATNREIVTRTVPALRTEESLRDAIPNLVRLETRSTVLKDVGYDALWNTRAERVMAEMTALRHLLSTEDEVRSHRKTLAAFGAYQQAVLSSRIRRDAKRPARGAVAAGAIETRRAAKRAEHSIGTLVEATHGALDRAQGRAQRLHRRTWATVVNALGLSLVAALAAALYLPLRITRSMRRLSAATTEIAQGSFTGPVQVESRDEVGELARAFDRMAERLGELDRAKEEFFSNISHELRTPLTSMREGILLLRERVAGPLEPKQERLVDIMQASTERVLGLVDRIMELSRLHAGLLAIEQRPVDLAGLARRAIEELRPHAEAHALLTDGDGIGEPVVVLGDANRHRAELVNLIGNAIKFTPPGGAVRVRVAGNDGVAEVVVEDTGAGIPTDALPRVFDRYWQASGARAGTGLGLAIVKGVVEAHGGLVTVESAEGKGSRFTVRLPRVEA